MPSGTAYAPDYILKVIRCGCGSTGAANPCKGSKCSCTSSMLPCTIFCNCGGGEGCSNPSNKYMTDTNDDDDDEST